MIPPGVSQGGLKYPTPVSFKGLIINLFILKSIKKGIFSKMVILEGTNGSC